MSGVFKAIGKVFKPIKKAVTSIAKGVKNVAKKVWESKIGKLLIMAAAVYFTYGAVTAYAAAPSAGIGAAMSSSASSMWSTAATLGSTGGAAGATGAAGAAGAGATGAAAAGAGTMTAANAAAIGAPAGWSSLGANALPAAAAGGAAGGGAAGGGIIAGAAGFMKANPLATLMIGQGVSSAASGMFAKDIAKNEREYLDRVRTSRGLYGRSYGGSGPELPTGDTGILAPFMKPLAAPPAPAVNATVAPSVSGTTQVPVTELANLKKQGLIAGSA